jgi:hypothetical protein
MAVPNVMLEKVEAALRRVPSERLADVLLFVEFLEYQAGNGGRRAEDDASEDAALWAAVEANHVYKAQHSGAMVLHESGADFMAATSDL